MTGKYPYDYELWKASWLCHQREKEIIHKKSKIAPKQTNAFHPATSTSGKENLQSVQKANQVSLSVK